MDFFIKGLVNGLVIGQSEHFPFFLDINQQNSSVVLSNSLPKKFIKNFRQGF